MSRVSTSGSRAALAASALSFVPAVILVPSQIRPFTLTTIAPSPLPSPAQHALQALFAVAAQENATTAGSNPMTPLPPPPPEISGFFLHNEEKSNIYCTNDANTNATNNDPHHSPRQAHEAEPDSAIAARRSNTRFRSESCADELLAAGRVASKEAFGDGGDGGSTGSGGGESAANVPRSRSCNWGTTEEEMQREPTIEDVSRRKVGWGTWGREGDGGGGSVPRCAALLSVELFLQTKRD